MRHSIPIQITLTVALASMLALSGCAIEGDTPAATAPKSDAAQSGAPQSDTTPEQKSSDFPDDIPVVTGAVTYSNASDNPMGKKWTLELAVEDHLAAASEARQLLTKAGFAEDSWNQSDSRAQGTFISSKYHVTVSAPGDSNGTILYEAIPR